MLGSRFEEPRSDTEEKTGGKKPICAIIEHMFYVNCEDAVLQIS
jgi:hypothetical protein